VLFRQGREGEKPMAREVLVALFRDLDGGEEARRQLERAGVPIDDMDLRSSELFGFSSAETAPPEGGIWNWLFAREPHYRRHIEQSGTILAVRADAADYDRIAALLLRHDLLARSEMVPDKTSESSRVRRYAIEDEDRVPLHEEGITVRAKPDR
jgi:hypothetical protein